MTRYVSKNHGLTLGSGNVFFFRDEHGDLKEFGAILTFEDYEIEGFNMLNLEIKTPAQQLVWFSEFWPIPSTDEFKLEVRLLQLKADVVRWLDANTPGWAVRPPRLNEMDPAPERIIFFRTRTDALTFANWIDELLTGIPTKIVRKAK